MRQHAALPRTRYYAGADGRQLLQELFVHVLLEPQAALQPAAAAADLRGVERRFLQLGHPHADRRHHHHVSIAADRPAAIPVVGEQLGLVAHADLPEFDAGVELAGHALHEVAEIDPHFGEEVADDTLAAEEVFEIDEFHRQSVLADQLLGLGELALLDADEVGEPLAVVGADVA